MDLTSDLSYCIERDTTLSYALHIVYTIIYITHHIFDNIQNTSCVIHIIFNI